MATASTVMIDCGGMMDLCRVKATFYTEGDEGTMEVRAWNVGAAVGLTGGLPREGTVVGGVLIVEEPKTVWVSSGAPQDGSPTTPQIAMLALVQDLQRQIDAEAVGV